MVNYKVVYRLHLYLFYLPASYTLVHKPCRSSLKHITRLPWRIHELYFPFSQISGPASPAASPRMRWLTFHCILVPLCQISHVKYKNISLANFYVSQRPNTMHHIWGMCYMQVMLCFSHSTSLCHLPQYYSMKYMHFFKSQSRM